MGNPAAGERRSRVDLVPGAKVGWHYIAPGKPQQPKIRHLSRCNKTVVSETLIFPRDLHHGIRLS
jgi:hypothetical protein